jgi:hypothetical protein
MVTSVNRVAWRILTSAALIIAGAMTGRAVIGQTIHVDAAAGHATNTIVPTQALGAGVDRLPYGASDKLLTQENLEKVLSAGWQTVTYRQNTELHMEAWHWNPEGKWSDPAGRGYFVGDAEPASAPIRHSYGYPLPHRGVTRDDGTDTVGYSRLTDGNLDSYWKSNPYLTQAYTGESDTMHPQWVFLDLANALPVNAIRIAWAEPYAVSYEVQYWTGEDPIKKPTLGVWVTFPGGLVREGKGGNATLQLADQPIAAQWLRILMRQSSNTCDTHGSADKRNCVGYAIRELYLGTTTPDGKFHDLIRHTADQDQTATYCSSVDPWHSPEDLDERAGEQLGLDYFYTSGVTRKLPAMIPIAMIYNVPEDAANELAYVEKRGYPISYVEMGEEPDGHYTPPEDDAALYIQFAAALHRVDPKLKLGGPVFTGQNKDIETWADSEGRTSWTRRFVDYLKAHGKLDELAFFPYEHYPVEPGKIAWSSLYDEPYLVTHIIDVWKQDGVPANVPQMITESNISWVDSEAFVDVWGALWLADYVGAYLSGGGQAVYYFHYLPLGIGHGHNGSQGTFGMFSADRETRKIIQPLSQFFASQLINLEWVQPGNDEHKLFAATSDVMDGAGHNLVTAYAALRPDGQWSLMVVNKDQENAHNVKVAFDGTKVSANNATASEAGFAGPVDVITFGAAQYQWHASPTGGHADPDGPAARSTVNATAATKFLLPAASVTVLRGKLAK